MIKKKDLIEFGFIEEVGAARVIYPYAKVLLADEDTGEPVLSLVVENFNQGLTFGIISQEGHTIYLSITSMDELRIIEKSIVAYKPNY
jgi:hypothetical protein